MLIGPADTRAQSLVKRSTLCELGLVPIVWPMKDIGDVIRFRQRRSLEGESHLEEVN